MRRLTMGAVLGGLAVYLFDPELGEERRERLFSLWRENRGSAVQAGRVVSQAAESARPLARRMTKAVGRGDWAEAFDRGRPAVSLPKLIGAAVIGAAVIGGALVYFLDPVKGPGAPAVVALRLAGKAALNAGGGSPGRPAGGQGCHAPPWHCP